jgi:ureidoglycolate lyase
MRELTPAPLTAEAFAPFGSMIQASDDVVKLDINRGHAARYDRLAEIDVADEGGVGVISLFRARPLTSLVLQMFERHPLGSQTFVPLSGPSYLVAVAPSGAFDPGQIRLFRAEGNQGVDYRKGTWHHSAGSGQCRFPRRRPCRARPQLRGSGVGARTDYPGSAIGVTYPRSGPRKARQVCQRYLGR